MGGTLPEFQILILSQYKNDTLPLCSTRSQRLWASNEHSSQNENGRRLKIVIKVI